MSKNRILSNKSRKVLIFSTSRADFDLLFPVFESLLMENFSVSFFAFINKDFPSSYKKRGGLYKKIIYKVIPKNTLVDLLNFIIYQTHRFILSYKPDLILVLGDRFETLSIAQLATLHHVPIVHVSGGEITKGAFDDNFRHAISKLSHLHFVSNSNHKKRLMQMGEADNNIFVTRELSFSNYSRYIPMTRKNLFSEIKITDGFQKYALVTLHPETMRIDPNFQIKTLVEALQLFPNLYCLFTSSNSDPGGDLINEGILKFVKMNSQRSKIVRYLGQNMYFSVLNNFDFMIGNSSSAYTEASYFPIHIIDIGERQSGRITHHNISRVNFDSKEIVECLTYLHNVTPKKIKLLSSSDPAKQIAKTLSNMNFDKLYFKYFQDRKI